MPEQQTLTIQQAIDLGVQHHNAGRLTEAESIYQQILQNYPNQPVALNLLGAIAHQAGKIDVAVDLITKAIAVRPDYAEAHTNLGLALWEFKRFDEAVSHYHKAIGLKPDFAAAHNNLGLALKDQGKREEAVASYQKALALNPGFTEAHNNLGNALKDQGKLEQAVASYQKALDLKPDYAEAHNNLGNARRDLGKLDEALTSYRNALANKPDFALAHNNLGLVLTKLGQLDDAAKSFRIALNIEPDSFQVLSNFGNTLRLQGILNEAIKYFQRSLEINPESSEVHSNFICCLNYVHSMAQDTIYEKSKEWERQILAAKVKPFDTHLNDRSPHRRLKIGYISPDFRVHSVSYFAKPLIASHDPAQVEIFCYSNNGNPDEMTKRIRTHSDHWRSIKGKSDYEVAQIINEDVIDILVDWAGHTENNRLLVLAHKPAPIQVTWHGHLNTTGLKAIDYRLTDTVADPESDENRQYSEQLYRLPTCTYCYAAPAGAQDISVKHKKVSKQITFGSFNNLCKVTPEVLSVWARVLENVPESRLLLKNRSFFCEATKNIYFEKFVELGIHPSRIELKEWTKSKKDHFDLYNQVDIGLDTFPFNGATTTCEALWMGVPVVTLSGNRHASRVGATMLNAVGLSEIVAFSEDEFIQKATLLAKNTNKLQILQSTLRARMKNSALCDAKNFAHQIELAYRDMWQQWCKT